MKHLIILICLLTAFCSLIYAQTNLLWNIDEIDKGQTYGHDIFDDGRNIHISYINDEEELIYGVKLSNNTWKKEKLDKGAIRASRIKIDSKGVIHIVYFYYSSNNFTVMHASKKPNNDWEYNEIGKDCGYESGTGGIGFDIDERGNLYVTYSYFFQTPNPANPWFQDSKYGVMLASYNGRQWAYEEIFKEGSLSNSTNVIIDRNTIHVAFRHEITRDRFQVVYGRKPLSGGSFTFETVASFMPQNRNLSWLDSDIFLACKDGNVFISYTYDGNLNVAVKKNNSTSWIKSAGNGSKGNIVYNNNSIWIVSCSRNSGLILGSSGINDISIKNDIIYNDLGSLAGLYERPAFSFRNKKHIIFVKTASNYDEFKLIHMYEK